MKKKTYYLFLDDIRTPYHTFCYTFNTVYSTKTWTTVRNYDDFVKVITENGLPELVSFDHDLANEHYAPQDQWSNYDAWADNQNFKEKTGYECAVWLVNYCMDNKQPLPEFLCHSMNPVGTEKILSLLKQYKEHEKENRL